MPGDFIGNLIANSEIPNIPQVRTFLVAVDDDYISTLIMEIVAGRGFSKDFNDSLNVIVNETAVRLLEYSDPIGRKVINPSPQPNQPSEFTIVGVVKDYHHLSLHTEIPPMVLFNLREQAIVPNFGIKVVTTDIRNVLNQIDTKWNEFEIERPISYSFLDDNLQQHYQSDLQSGQIFAIFTIVTIIMACRTIRPCGIFHITTDKRNWNS